MPETKRKSLARFRERFNRIQTTERISNSKLQEFSTLANWNTSYVYSLYSSLQIHIHV